MKSLRLLFFVCMVSSCIACSKTGSRSNSTTPASLNSVEARIAGTWKLVSKTDSAFSSPGVFTGATVYSNFKYNATVSLGTNINNLYMNPVAKVYTYSGVNIGHSFSGPPDSTINGTGSWYYDSNQKSIYVNFGRYGFSLITDTDMSISVIGNQFPLVKNTWLFSR